MLHSDPKLSLAGLRSVTPSPQAFLFAITPVPFAIGTEVKLGMNDAPFKPDIMNLDIYFQVQFSTCQCP